MKLDEIKCISSVDSCFHVGVPGQFYNVQAFMFPCWSSADLLLLPGLKLVENYYSLRPLLLILLIWMYLDTKMCLDTSILGH
jgi:hypothetical protein